MNHRERLLATLRFEPVDRGVDLEFGAWTETIERWHHEGLPAEFTGCDPAIDQYCGCDNIAWGPQPWMICGLWPSFETKILEEHGDRYIIQDGEGVVSERSRNIISIPRYIKHPIETRADWEKFKAERLNPDEPGRLPNNLDELAGLCADRDTPVLLGLGSLYGWPRNWMGVENISYALHDDFALVEDMVEHLTKLTLKLLENFAGRFRIDLGHWWEDICFNKGPLLSPAHFRQLLTPRYQRITDFLRRECGTQFHCLDCDGNIHELVGPWLDGGINVMFPVEALHTDPHRIAREFGKRVPMRGAFNKLALIAGKQAIDVELNNLAPLYAQGGLIPHTDHRVPPDVSWENFLYYRQKKCALLGKRAWRKD